MKSNRPAAGLSIVAVACALSFGADAAPSVDPGCRTNPALTGPCYRVRGRVGLSGDSGLVLGRDDTGRVLVIRPAPHRSRDLPPDLDRALARAQENTGFASAWVHGRFEVCPIPADLPERTYVCIQSAAGLATERPGARRSRDTARHALGARS